MRGALWLVPVSAGDLTPTAGACRELPLSVTLQDGEEGEVAESARAHTLTSLKSSFCTGSSFTSFGCNHQLWLWQ